MAEENKQNSFKYNPEQVKEQFADKSSENKIEVESDKERQEKYGGWLGATLVTEGEDYVEEKIAPFKSAYEKGSELGKELKADYEKGQELLQLPLEEQVAKIEKEKQDAQKAEDDAKKAEQAEKDRLENLKKQYIVNGAMIECSCSPDRSYVVIPISHGEYINNIAQLNVGDCLPNTNIISFKVCQSPSNPSVKEAAKDVLEKAQDRNKGFYDRFMDSFGEPSEIDTNKIDAELLKQCAGECKYDIDSGQKWIDGEETVLIDGQPALLGRCTISCIYGGEIKFYSSGQEK